MFDKLNVCAAHGRAGGPSRRAGLYDDPSRDGSQGAQRAGTDHRAFRACQNTAGAGGRAGYAVDPDMKERHRRSCNSQNYKYQRGWRTSWSSLSCPRTRMTTRTFFVEIRGGAGGEGKAICSPPTCTRMYHHVRG